MKWIAPPPPHTHTYTPDETRAPEAWHNRLLKNVCAKVHNIEIQSEVLELHKQCQYMVFRQINAPCALTDILVSSGGTREYYSGFSPILGHFWSIFAHFEGNISPESAGGMFIRVGGFIWQNTVPGVCDLAQAKMTLKLYLGEHDDNSPKLFKGLVY